MSRPLLPWEDQVPDSDLGRLWLWTPNSRPISTIIGSPRPKICGPEDDAAPPANFIKNFRGLHRSGPMPSPAYMSANVYSDPYPPTCRWHGPCLQARFVANYVESLRFYHARAFERLEHARHTGRRLPPRRVWRADIVSVGQDPLSFLISNSCVISRLRGVGRAPWARHYRLGTY